jgi:hypothetical protein
VISPQQLSPAQSEVLRLLVDGLSRPAISDKMHMSLRTVDHRIAEIKSFFSTEERFCLGARAVRCGAVDGSQVVSRARTRRPDQQWVPPTGTAVVIMNRLAAGSTVAHAGKAVGMAARGVRELLFRFRIGNGAVRLTHAGALYEALGWGSIGERGSCQD